VRRIHQVRVSAVGRLRLKSLRTICEALSCVMTRWLLNKLISRAEFDHSPPDPLVTAEKAYTGSRRLVFSAGLPGAVCTKPSSFNWFTQL
jgi:hypothetical protein